jgi:predicted XRE-type DNA-binding protein
MARSVFYDIADTPGEAANITARSLLMIAIEERVKGMGWTQTEARRFFMSTSLGSRT